MKLFIGLLSLLLFSSCPSDSVYTLSVTALDGTTTSLSGFSGRKLLVFPFTADSSSRQLLLAMDSLQQADADSLVVIGVPALDFDSSLTIPSVTALKDSLGIGLRITQPGYVTKAAGSTQLPVFQWLTSLSHNGHFDRDVNQEGQLFVVDKTGVLYSIIEMNMYRSVFGQVLHVSVSQ
jgi:glutathione peroxidase-family protein